MFDGQTREFRCDRIGCDSKAAAPDGRLPEAWKRLSEDLPMNEGTVHAWWVLCPACAQLLSFTTK